MRLEYKNENVTYSKELEEKYIKWCESQKDYASNSAPLWIPGLYEEYLYGIGEAQTYDLSEKNIEDYYRPHYWLEEGFFKFLIDGKYINENGEFEVDDVWGEPLRRRFLDIDDMDLRGSYIDDIEKMQNEAYQKQNEELMTEITPDEDSYAYDINEDYEPDEEEMEAYWKKQDEEEEAYYIDLIDDDSDDYYDNDDDDEY